MKVTRMIGLWRGVRPLMLCVAVTAICPGVGQARTAPPSADGGAVYTAQQKINGVVLPPRISGKTVIRANMPTRHTDLQSLHLSMEGFKFENNPLVDAREVDEVLGPWQGRDLSFPQFEQAMHALADYLRANGHPNARVVVSRSRSRQGMVAMAVEGLSQGKPEAPTMMVRAFNITGNTVVPTDELQEVLRPWVGRDLSVEEMQAAAEAVAAHMRNAGYPLIQAYLPRQRIDDGVIDIAVQEGPVDGGVGQGGIIVTQAGDRVRPQVIETILGEGIVPGRPVKSEDLERALKVASDLPGVDNVRVNLAPGAEPGTTQVEAMVDDENLVTGAVWGDNYGNTYTGSRRGNVLLNLNSPIGYGEQLSVNGSRSEGMRSWKVATQVPVGATGARLGASYSSMNVDIKGDFAPLDINSSTRVASVFGSYPLIRSNDANLSVSANVDHKRVKNNFLGRQDNDRKLLVSTVALSGDAQDPFGGQDSFYGGLTLGKLNLDGNKAYQSRDAVTAQTEGTFAKLTGGMTRLQALDDNADWTWYTGLSGQFANKNLDTVEKFQLGGPTGVRAYPVGEGLGDSGWLASVELRRRLVSTVLGDIGAFTFADAGGIRQYKDPWAGAVGDNPNSYILKGFGGGLSLTGGDYGTLKIMYARKIGDNPAPTYSGTDSDGTDDEGRIWVFGAIKF